MVQRSAHKESVHARACVRICMCRFPGQASACLLVCLQPCPCLAATSEECLAATPVQSYTIGFPDNRKPQYGTRWVCKPLGPGLMSRLCRPYTCMAHDQALQRCNSVLHCWGQASMLAGQCLLVPKVPTCACACMLLCAAWLVACSHAWSCRSALCCAHSCMP